MEKIAIIFAGGVGSRMGSNIPKQFLEVQGKPIIIHTLEKFEYHKEITKIYVACKEELIEELKEMVKVPFSIAPPHLSMQRAGAVGALSELYFSKGKYTDAGSFRPDYIKASQAEREREEAEEKGLLRELSAGGHSLYV